MKFDLVQSHVLGMNILPSLQEAFAYVQNEDRRRSAMLPPTSTDRSAILSAPSRDKAGLPLSSHPSGKDSLFCDYCRWSRHTREIVGSFMGLHQGAEETALVIEAVVLVSREYVGPTLVFISPVL